MTLVSAEGAEVAAPEAWLVTTPLATVAAAYHYWFNSVLLRSLAEEDTFS